MLQHISTRGVLKSWSAPLCIIGGKTDRRMHKFKPFLCPFLEEGNFNLEGGYITSVKHVRGVLKSGRLFFGGGRMGTNPRGGTPHIN